MLDVFLRNVSEPWMIFGYYGHAAMLRNEEAGNAMIKRMSDSFLDDKGYPALSCIAKTRTYVLRHGVIE